MSIIAASLQTAPVPTVSVLMAVYNGERHVEEAIASVLRQDFHNLELVIIDDASTDSSPQIVRHWAESDPRIVVVQAAENGGIVRSLNRGLAVARGKYIALLDQDDLGMDSAFGAQAAVLDRESDVVLVSTGYDRIDSHGRWIGRTMPPPTPEVVVYFLTFENPISGVMYRREVVREIGGYHPEFELSQDYDLTTRLSQHGRLAVLQIVGFKHRMHDKRASAVWFEQQQLRSLKISYRMMTKLLGREVKPDENSAVASVWRAKGLRGVASTAHAVLSEAFGHFTASANRFDRRYVRLVTALRWLRSANALARQGFYIEAAHHAGYSLLWHPLGLPAAVVAKLKQSAMPLLRTRKR